MFRENQSPFFFFPFMDQTKIIEEEKSDSLIEGEFFSPKLSLLHGNSFKKEYCPYKSYQPTLKEGENAEEELLRKIQMYGLLVHDLNLHLDIYPMDKDVYYIYKKYNDEYLLLCKEYQEKYHPLLVKEATYDDKFNWVCPSLYKEGI